MAVPKCRLSSWAKKSSVKIVYTNGVHVGIMMSVPRQVFSIHNQHELLASVKVSERDAYKFIVRETIQRE